jgi:hypothetical protein
MGPNKMQVFFSIFLKFFQKSFLAFLKKDMRKPVDKPKGICYHIKSVWTARRDVRVV